MVFQLFIAVFSCSHCLVVEGSSFRKVNLEVHFTRSNLLDTHNEILLEP